MARTTLRAALAACGGIAGLTLSAAAESPDFEVVALQDPDPDALRRTGERYGIARRHAEFPELLTRDVDFVIVNSPNHLHLPQVRAAAAAGKPCLVQKPMARTLDEAREMAAEAKEHGVRLGVMMFELGHPLHHEVREMVGAGWFGKPILVQAASAHAIYLRDPPPPGDWRRDPAKVGGGAFIQLAVHAVNLATFLLSREITSVSAGTTRGETVFPDETTLVTAAFEGGPLGHFAASYATDLYGFTLCGTRGRVHLLPDHVILKGEEPWRGRILTYESPGREVSLPRADLETAVERLRPEVEVHGAFARWIRDGGEFPAPGERGLRDMEVVDAVHRSVREKTWIDT